MVLAPTLRVAVLMQRMHSTFWHVSEGPYRVSDLPRTPRMLNVVLCSWNMPVLHACMRDRAPPPAVRTRLETLLRVILGHCHRCAGGKAHVSNVPITGVGCL